MWQKIRIILLAPRTLFVMYCIAALFAAIQLTSLGTHDFSMPPEISGDIMYKTELMKLFIGKKLTDYNNYLIFKNSFFHLISGQNLYTVYPSEHWDFYKYSPTFALFMGALAYLPDVVGLSIWNLLNSLSLFLAVTMLPFSKKSQCLILWFIGIELLTSLQNAQSNGLMCGLLIAAYTCMQRQKIIWATLWILLATYIKVYGAIGFCLFLFYPGKLKFIAYTVFWGVLLAVLPLAVTPASTLVWQYQNWAQLLQADRSAAYGISVMGWLHSWFGVSSGKEYITLTGVFLFLLPFIRFKLYQHETYRLLMLASLLLWVIIFNHKAESPTFIIAVAGVAIWYFTHLSTATGNSVASAKWRTVLLWVTFIFTILSATDLFPPFVKQQFLVPYNIKVVPCIIVWCVIFVELMTINGNKESAVATT